LVSAHGQHRRHDAERVAGGAQASGAWPVAVARARFQTRWPVALTDKRASAKFEFPRFSIFHILKSKTEVFVMSKIGELFEVINEITRNNFPFWLLFQILLDFELKNIETIQI
jgi:hypothetical protein